MPTRPSRLNAAPAAANGQATSSQGPVLFCNASEAHAELIRRGFPRDARVLTSSPALVISGNDRYVDRTAALFPKAIKWLTRETGPASLLIRDTIAATPQINRFALSAAHATVNATKLIMQSMTLDDAHLTFPVALGEIRTGNGAIDERYNPPLSEVLADNPDLSVVECPVSLALLEEQSMQQVPSLATRLRFLPASNFELRLWQLIWRALPHALGRGTLLIARDNQLLRDAAAVLARHRFRISSIEISRPKGQALESGEEQALRDAVAAPLSSLLHSSMPPGIRQATHAAVVRRIVSAAEQYDASLSGWRKALAQRSEERITGLLTNMLAGPHLTALFDACRERDIPVFSFQHGHARELNQTLSVYGAVLEEAATDVMFTYSTEATVVTDQNPFSVARAERVGLPRDYLKSGKFRRRKKHAPPVTYVCTGAMTSHRLLPGTCVWSDVRKARFEIDLISTVLGEIPYDVLYKPYPSNGYIDPSPVIEAARATRNVRYFSDGFDLRYTLPDARVIVTSRCTSTLGWCLAPVVPVVFLDLPDQLPPTPAFRQALERSVFYLDAATDGWQTTARDLLSRPLQDLEVEWHRKKGDRADMFERFFGERDGRAGMRAARHVLKAITKESPSRA